MSAASVDALRLRAWAWGLLRGEAPSPPPAAGEDGWRFFLRVERIATPLRSRLAASSIALSADDERRLADAASVEMKRHLSAKMQLATLARVARANGWRVVALKGGLAALGIGEPVDVADVDVLLSRDEAPLLARALEEEAGYALTKGEDRMDLPGVHHHLGQRRAATGIQVEIHFDLPNTGDPAPQLARAVAAPRAGLLRLAGADHLWHVLAHATLDHAFRRGTLRDVLVLSAALANASREEAEEVERRAAGHPFAAPLARMLAMARAVRDGAPLADPFPEIAAANYLLIERLTPRNLPEPLADEVSRQVFTALGDPADREGFRARFLRFAHESTLGRVAALERRARWLGRAVRVAVRAGRAATAVPLALPVVRESRRSVRQAAAG
ncbi:MAG TPA: nucleotidyltransferase family protein [Longimicrobium sp.]|nr:nucleotidyltransferase family protein [Longimicrobium sp.]